MSMLVVDEERKILTRSERVMLEIKSDIVTCRLMPGDRLRIEVLRDRYEIGASPIREALMRLEAEGLVDLEQNKGFRVASASVDSLMDLSRSRSEIEEIALRWSIEKGGVDWEVQLLGAMHRLSKQTKENPEDPTSLNVEWISRHKEFHLALISACGSPTIYGILENLYDLGQRYVGLSILSDAKQRDDQGEHEAIMQAALDRNADLCVELSRKHVAATTERVAASIPDTPAWSSEENTSG